MNSTVLILTYNIDFYVLDTVFFVMCHRTFYGVGTLNNYIIIIIVDGSRVNQVTTGGVDKPDIPILAPSQIREYQAHAPQLDVCDLRQLEKIY